MNISKSNVIFGNYLKDLFSFKFLDKSLRVFTCKQVEEFYIDFLTNKSLKHDYKMCKNKSNYSKRILVDLLK